MAPHKTSIRSKLAVVIGLPLLLVVVLGAFNVQQLKAVHDMTRNVRDVSLPKVLALETVKQSMTSHRLLANRYIEARDFRQLAEISKAMRGVVRDIELASDNYRNTVSSSSEEVASLARFATAFSEYLDTYQRVLRTSEQGDIWLAKKMFDEDAVAAFEHAFAILNQLSDVGELEMATTASQAKAVYERALQLTGAAAAVVFAIAALSIWWVSKNVSLPLLKISAAMKSLTDGAGDTEVPDWGGRKDEIGTLAKAAAAYRESVVRSEELAALAETERQRLRSAIKNMPLGICLLNAKRKITMCNDEFIGLYNLPRELHEAGVAYEDVLANIAKENLPDTAEQSEFLVRTMSDIATREMITGQWDFAEQRSIKVAVQPMPGGWVTIHEDVTEGLAAQERIRYMARHDALTDLPNRNVFSETITAALRRACEGTRSAILTLDLDRFKAINDTLGHPTGDKMLRQVATRLQRIGGAADVIARMGGDEFAIIQTTPRGRIDVEELASKIIEDLSQPYEIDNQVLRVGVSIGVAMITGQSSDAEALLKHADLALYEAKGAGRGTYRFFEEAMDRQAQERRRMELELGIALERGQIVPYFQPIVRIETGRISGFEALARWEHPARGLIYPGEFIGIAEEVGLIHRLSETIMHRACVTAAGWPEGVRLGLNLSPHQFLAGSLMGSLSGAIKGSGIDPARLDLEVTENVLLDDGPQTMKAMHEMRAMGAAIAIDDFGIGYSSLSYVQRFPFDKIKVDRSFIANLTTEPNALAIVRSVAALCKGLGIRSTAEGVETEAQLNAVRAEGLSEAQGYLFGRAVPADEVAELLAKSEFGGVDAA